MSTLNDEYQISVGPIDVAIADLTAAPTGLSAIVTVTSEARDDGSVIYEGQGLRVAIRWDAVAGVPTAEVIAWPGHEDEIAGRLVAVSDLPSVRGVA